MSIRENLEAIRAEIDAAARETGRTGADITLVGASKMNDAAACQEAIAAGIDALGENRVQEMTAKLAEDAYRGAPLHFIGHLQRNKVKQVVGKVALIQSIGSPELLAEVDKQAEKLGIVQDILLEVNIGGEAAKSGFAPQEVENAAAQAKEMDHVRVRGLMTIPPADATREENVVYFQKVQALYVDINRKMYDNGLEYLSMGMSGDLPMPFARGPTWSAWAPPFSAQETIPNNTREVLHMGLMDELKKIIHPYDDEDYDYEDDFEEPVKESSRSLFDDRKDDRREDRRSEDRHNKVVNIHATTQLKVVLVKPERFENASEIADHLKEKRTVVLNLESTNKDVARRLIDFLSGVAYAGEGKIKKVAANTYIITPYSVDIMGDLIDELENNGLYF